MAADKRWLEIGADGIAFHERFLPAGVVPPAEVFYCDCNGIGRETWNPHTAPKVALSADEQADAACMTCGEGCGALIHEPVGDIGHVFTPPLERQQSPEEWKAEHADEGCVIRRQIFVDVSDRKIRKAARGMTYDEKSGSFSVPDGFVFNANEGAYEPTPKAVTAR